MGSYLSISTLLQVYAKLSCEVLKRWTIRFLDLF